MLSSSSGECISVGVKAHVLYSRMLRDEEFFALFHCDSVAEIVDQLRNIEGYSSRLERLSPGEVNRHDVEAVLKTRLLFDANTFLIHFNGPRDVFFRRWVALYEAKNLKTIFRNLLNQNTNKENLRKRLYPIPGTTLEYEKILLARNFSEMAEAFSGTPYYKVLLEPLKRIATGEERTLFPLEMALDIFVENNLHKAMKLLSSMEQRLLSPFFSSRVDLLNLYTVYRSIVFYKMPHEEILNRLLQVRYRLQLPQLKLLARAADSADFVDVLQSVAPCYAPIFEGVDKYPSPQLVLEKNINRYLYTQALKIYRSSAPHFHTAIACFLLLEFEIKDLIKIIENVRYGFERKEAVAYLIRPILVGGDILWQ